MTRPLRYCHVERLRDPERNPGMTAPKRVTLAGPTLPLSTNGHTARDESVDQPRLLAALRGVRAGDFGVRLPLDWTRVPGTISEFFNEAVEHDHRLAQEFAELTSPHANVRAQLTDLTY